MGLLIESNKLFPYEPQRELRLTLFKGLKKKSFPEGTTTHKEWGQFAILQAQRIAYGWEGESEVRGSYRRRRQGKGEPDSVAYLGDGNQRIRRSRSRSVPATRDLVSNKMKEKGQARRGGKQVCREHR